MTFGDPRIESVSDERSSGDGIWLYLKKGWKSSQDTHCVHEDTVKECREELENVMECSCIECRR